MAAWGFALLLLIGFYVASFGPYAGFRHRRLVPRWMQPYCETFYHPIMWLEMKTTFYEENPVGIAYIGYILWWEDRPRTTDVEPPHAPEESRPSGSESHGPARTTVPLFIE